MGFEIAVYSYGLAARCGTSRSIDIFQDWELAWGSNVGDKGRRFGSERFSLLQMSALWRAVVWVHLGAAIGDFRLTVGEAEQ